MLHTSGIERATTRSDSLQPVRPRPYRRSAIWPRLGVLLTRFGLPAACAPGGLLFLVAIAAGLVIAGDAAAGRSEGPSAPLFSTPVERCIVPAAQYHGVNAHVLRAILKVESNLSPGAVGKNENGSVDVGIGQMNSTHFKDLARFGIGPGQLQDACIGTFVAAWHLKKNMASHGNTWEAVARYHSGTPYFNKRYQILLVNELIRAHVLEGAIRPVPPLRRITFEEAP